MTVGRVGPLAMVFHGAPLRNPRQMAFSASPEVAVRTMAPLTADT